MNKQIGNHVRPVWGGAAIASLQLEGRSRTFSLQSSLGTVVEWYEFLLFGSLAPIIARQFFTKLDPSTGLILVVSQKRYPTCLQVN